MRNHFWQRWQKEVLHQYQLRSKWLSANSSLKPGDLVLISDISLPATKWPLARVLQLHYGRDGLPRVASLKTASTTLERTFAKLIRLPLPTAADEADQLTMAGGPDDLMAGGAEDIAEGEEDGEDEEEAEDVDRAFVQAFFATYAL